MTNRLMVSVAALALMAGTGLANAQGTGMGREAQSTAPAQQSAPSSDRGTTGSQINRDAKQPEMKSTQSDAKNQRADDSTQLPKTKTLSTENADQAGQNRDKTTGQSMKSENREENNDLENAQRIDQKMSDEAEGKIGRHSSQTVGLAGAKRSSEQRTRSRP